MNRRFERRAIDGAPRGYTIAADGQPRKWGRHVPITKNIAGLPTIDLEHYTGPIPGTHRPRDDDGEPYEHIPGERLLDEIVAYAFHGRPPGPIFGLTVIHLDGDATNCAAANLAWRPDPDWMRDRDIKPLMRPGHLPRRITYYGALI